MKRKITLPNGNSLECSNNQLLMYNTHGVFIKDYSDDYLVLSMFNMIYYN